MARKKKVETVEDEALIKSEFVGSGMLDAIKVNVKPKTENQKIYWKHLRDTNKEIVICGGDPGCGKSYMSIAYALKALKDGEYENVKILVPTIEASNALKIGLLPGTIQEKIAPWKESTSYLMSKILRQSEVYEPDALVKWLMSSKKITFEIMSYIRGRNFDNSLLLLEEAENLSPEEMLLAITRCGDGSKIVISGDSRQCDREFTQGKSGLEHAMKVLDGMDEVGIVRFGSDDVVRNDIITKILKIW